MQLDFEVSFTLINSGEYKVALSLKLTTLSKSTIIN